ncbi:MAG: hypothetical protein DRP27_02890 [Thermotogae bacterium]|nr:MAG: hypothetical protein DRP27_02890 [Thermotogota bacterium]
MKELNESARRYTIAITIITLIEIPVLFFFLKYRSLYILVGGGLAVLNVQLLKESIERQLVKKVKRTGYALRYLLNVIIVSLFGLIDRLSVIPIVVGLLNLKLAIFFFWRWISEAESDQRR